MEYRKEKEKNRENCRIVWLLSVGHTACICNGGFFSLRGKRRKGRVEREERARSARSALSSRGS